MSTIQAIFLAIIQGLTEFLPVSSSGHLVIFQNMFGLHPPVLFDIFVHVGTLAAILVYFRKEIGKISRSAIYLIIIGTIPAAFVGLFLNDKVESIFASVNLVGYALLVNSVLLFSSSLVKKANKSIKKLGIIDAVVIGLFQALAILPGISRSGATITSGLWRKASHNTAFRFSFYLATPAILGALILQIPEIAKSSTEYLLQGVLGSLIAGIVGYFALGFLKRVLVSDKLWMFGIYCFILGIIILL
jgi:undecaprenyl-diphosphatase